MESDKDPLRVLIHEIGHIKWPGYGKTNPNGLHDPEFYKLLGDSLTRFGLPPDVKDTEGTDLDNVVSPAGDSDPRLFNVAPPCERKPSTTSAATHSSAWAARMSSSVRCG